MAHNYVGLRCIFSICLVYSSALGNKTLLPKETCQKDFHSGYRMDDNNVQQDQNSPQEKLQPHERQQLNQRIAELEQQLNSSQCDHHQSTEQSDEQFGANDQYEDTDEQPSEPYAPPVLGDAEIIEQDEEDEIQFNAGAEHNRILDSIANSAQQDSRANTDEPAKHKPLDDPHTDQHKSTSADEVSKLVNQVFQVQTKDKITDPIHESLLPIIRSWVFEKQDNNIIKELIKAMPRASNCEFLLPLLCNPEIYAGLSQSARNVDRINRQLSNQVLSVIKPMASILDQILKIETTIIPNAEQNKVIATKQGDVNITNLRKLTTDVCKILGNLYYTQNTRRKVALRPFLNREFQLLTTSQVKFQEHLLFGADIHTSLANLSRLSRVANKMVKKKRLFRSRPYPNRGRGNMFNNMSKNYQTPAPPQHYQSQWQQNQHVQRFRQVGRQNTNNNNRARGRGRSQNQRK